jgi:K+-sensing histidine kinase KdpD
MQWRACETALLFCRGYAMPAADDAPDRLPYGPLDHLRHDLKSPLTTIYARAQLLARSIRGSPSLSEDERTRMLAGITAIEGAVREMVTVVEGLSNAGDDDRNDPG